MVSRHCINSLQQGKAFLITDLSRRDLTVYFLRDSTSSSATTAGYSRRDGHLTDGTFSTIIDLFKDQNHQSFLKGHIQSKKLFGAVSISRQYFQWKIVCSSLYNDKLCNLDPIYHSLL